MTLPDFVEHFCSYLTLEKAASNLLDYYGMVLFKGNNGHQEILRAEGKCMELDPVPLVFFTDESKLRSIVHDIINVWNHTRNAL